MWVAGAQGHLTITNRNALAQAVIVAVIDQDLVVFRYDGVPVGPLGETAGRRAVRQGDFGGQRDRVIHSANNVRDADDNQDDDCYKASNHRGSQDRYQNPEKP